MAASQPAVRSAHPYKMYDQIVSQADQIATVLERERDRCAELAERLGRCRRIYLVGIGTSWHAALAGAAMMRSGPEVLPVNSFEFCTDTPPIGAEDAAIILSHTGAKRVTYEALDVAREQGAFTIAVSSTEPGPRVAVADELIHTCPGETSAAYTVSYTTALTVLAMLDAAMAGESEELERLPGLVVEVLAMEPAVRKVVEQHAERRRFVSASWGSGRATAYEVALKIKETSRADCEGFQIEHLLHGPFCELDADCLLTVIASNTPDRGRAVDLVRAARALGAPVWAVCHGHADELAAAGAEVLRLPSPARPVEPILGAALRVEPILGVIPLQLFTYHLALARGTHPDLFQQDDPLQAAAYAQVSL